MSIKHAHDRFFKESFSRPDVVIDFIRVFLPEDTHTKFNFSTLKREPDSFIDEQLAEHLVDLLYTVEYGGTSIRIALLFEHKSYREDYPHFQLNRYLLNFWEHQIKQKQEFCPVVPIVIYHGDRRWKQRSMTSYFPILEPSLATFIPDFSYWLINLSTATSDQLEQLQTGYAKLTAGLLRAIRQRQQIFRLFEELADVVDKLANTVEGSQFLTSVFFYTNFGSDLTVTEVIAIFRQVSTQTGTIAMSAGEQLLAQGAKIGAEEATVKYVKGLLRVGMDAQTISTAFDIPLAKVKRMIEQIKKGEL